MATSAFRVNPTALSAAGPPLPRWRPRFSYRPQVKYVPMKSSETILKYDFLKITANSSDDEVERALDPQGSAGATVTGDSGGIPRYFALESVTSGSGNDHKDVIAVFDITECEFLFRLNATAAADAEPQDVKVIDYPRIHVGSTAISTVFYEWGIFEIGTGSDNYFPIVDVANQDATNGGVAIVEIPTEVGIGDDLAPVWVVFGGLS